MGVGEGTGAESEASYDSHPLGWGGHLSKHCLLGWVVDVPVCASMHSYVCAHVCMHVSAHMCVCYHVCMTGTCTYG